MIEARRGVCLAPESFQPNGVLCTFNRKELQSDKSKQTELARLVHFTHAAASEQAKYLIASDLWEAFQIPDHKIAWRPSARVAFGYRGRRDNAGQLRREMRESS